jgi:hypothetical protein
METTQETTIVLAAAQVDDCTAPKPVRHCSYCRSIAHTKNNCAQKVFDEINRHKINEKCYHIDHLLKSFITKEQVTLYFRSIEVCFFRHLWAFLFPKKPFPLTKGNEPDCEEIVSSCIQYYTRRILTHPQYTRRQQQYELQQQKWIVYKKNYKSTRANLLSQIDNLNLQINMLEINLRDREKEYNRLPPIVEFKIELLKTMDIEHKYKCYSCLEDDIPYDEIVLTNCNHCLKNEGEGEGSAAAADDYIDCICYTCCNKLIDSQAAKESFPCPMCREQITTLKTWSPTKFDLLKRRYHV